MSVLDLSSGFAQRRRMVEAAFGPVKRALGAGKSARYIEPMQYILPVLVVIAMLATLGTLLFGIISMAKGGNPQRSNKLMRSRVLLQGAALLLFVIFMLLYRH